MTGRGLAPPGDGRAASLAWLVGQTVFARLATGESLIGKLTGQTDDNIAFDGVLLALGRHVLELPRLIVARRHLVYVHQHAPSIAAFRRAHRGANRAGA